MIATLNVSRIWSDSIAHAFSALAVVIQRGLDKVLHIGNFGVRIFAHSQVASVYLQDDFSGSHLAELNGALPDIGAAWACTANGYWRYNTGQANNSGGTARPLVSDCGVADGTLQVSCDDGWAYIVARYYDDNNYWQCGAFGDSAIGVPLKLYEYNGGVTTERGSANYFTNFSPRKTVLNGSTIEVWQDGALRITYASATFNQSATKHGINSLQGGRLFDDISMIP